MTFKVPPYSSGALAQVDMPSASPKALSTLAMAPLSLTPLRPPGSGPVPVVAAKDGRIAAERRQTFFADKQTSLLDRLRLLDVTAPAVPASTLSAAQRSACVAVLASIVAATTT
jgi:hypothetical protein